MQANGHTGTSQLGLDELLNSVTGSITTRVPIYDPPCACPECETQFYSVIEQRFTRWHYAGTFSNAQARETIAGYIKSIKDDRSYLLDSIQLRGDKILSRWRKRSVVKRAALIEQVEPGMPKEAWAIPRLEYAPTSLNDIRTMYRHICILPYLDVETLTKDSSTLIGLLELPSLFIATGVGTV